MTEPFPLKIDHNFSKPERLIRSKTYSYLKINNIKFKNFNKRLN